MDTQQPTQPRGSNNYQQAQDETSHEHEQHQELTYGSPKRLSPDLKENRKSQDFLPNLDLPDPQETRKTTDFSPNLDSRDPQETRKTTDFSPNLDSRDPQETRKTTDFTPSRDLSDAQDTQKSRDDTTKQESAETQENLGSNDKKQNRFLLDTEGNEHQEPNHYNTSNLDSQQPPRETGKSHKFSKSRESPGSQRTQTFQNLSPNWELIDPKQTQKFRDQRPNKPSHDQQQTRASQELLPVQYSIPNPRSQDSEEYERSRDYMLNLQTQDPLENRNPHHHKNPRRESSQSPEIHMSREYDPHRDISEHRESRKSNGYDKHLEATCRTQINSSKPSSKARLQNHESLMSNQQPECDETRKSKPLPPPRIQRSNEYTQNMESAIQPNKRESVDALNLNWESSVQASKQKSSHFRQRHISSNPVSDEEPSDLSPRMPKSNKRGQSKPSTMFNDDESVIAHSIKATFQKNQGLLDEHLKQWIETDLNTDNVDELQAVYTNWVETCRQDVYNKSRATIIKEKELIQDLFETASDKFLNFVTKIQIGLTKFITISQAIIERKTFTQSDDHEQILFDKLRTILLESKGSTASPFIDQGGKKLIENFVREWEYSNLSQCQQEISDEIMRESRTLHNNFLSELLQKIPFCDPDGLCDLHAQIKSGLLDTYENAFTNHVNIPEETKKFELQLSTDFDEIFAQYITKLEINQLKIKGHLEKQKKKYYDEMDHLLANNAEGIEPDEFQMEHDKMFNEAVCKLEKDISKEICSLEPMDLHVASLQKRIDKLYKPFEEENNENWGKNPNRQKKPNSKQRNNTHALVSKTVPEDDGQHDENWTLQNNGETEETQNIISSYDKEHYSASSFPSESSHLQLKGSGRSSKYKVEPAPLSQNVAFSDENGLRKKRETHASQTGIQPLKQEVYRPFVEESSESEKWENTQQITGKIYQPNIPHVESASLAQGNAHIKKHETLTTKYGVPGNVVKDRSSKHPTDRETLAPILFQVSLGRIGVGMTINNTSGHEISFAFHQAEVGLSGDDKWICGNGVSARKDVNPDYFNRVWELGMCLTTENWEEKLHFCRKSNAITAEFLFTIFLRYFKETFENEMMGNINATMISVPFWFSNCQRIIFSDAAKLAGFSTVAIVNENSASAFYHYNVDVHSNNTQVETVVISENSHNVDISIYSYDRSLCSVTMLEHAGDYQLPESAAWKRTIESIIPIKVYGHLVSYGDEDKVSTKLNDLWELAFSKLEKQNPLSTEYKKLYIIINYETDSYKNLLQNFALEKALNKNTKYISCDKKFPMYGLSLIQEKFLSQNSMENIIRDDTAYNVIVTYMSKKNEIVSTKTDRIANSADPYYVCHLPYQKCEYQFYHESPFCQTKIGSFKLFYESSHITEVEVTLMRQNDGILTLHKVECAKTSMKPWIKSYKKSLEEEDFMWCPLQLSEKQKEIYRQTLNQITPLNPIINNIEPNREAVAQAAKTSSQNQQNQFESFRGHTQENIYDHRTADDCSPSLDRKILPQSTSNIRDQLKAAVQIGERTRKAFLGGTVVFKSELARKFAVEKVQEALSSLDRPNISLKDVQVEEKVLKSLALEYNIRIN